MTRRTRDLRHHKDRVLDPGPKPLGSDRGQVMESQLRDAPERSYWRTGASA